MVLRVFALLILCSVTALCARAEPFRIQDLNQELIEAGVENIDQAILFGQPMITGEMKRFGFNIGLRECARVGREDLYCQELAFKSCVMLTGGADRLALLELANSYNLSRRSGFLVLDNNDRLGGILCVQTTLDFRDDNKLEYDEIDHLEQIIDDFRSFLVESEVSLLDPSRL